MAKNKSRVNNVTRLLASRAVPHEVIELPDDEKRSAVDTAALLGVDPAAVFKTIVVVRPTPRSKPLLVMTPGDAAVDLRVLAKSLGEKKLSLPTQREAEQLTGLQAGGISPLALLNKGFEMVVDETVILHDWVHISGGERGLNVKLRPDDLIALTGASVVAVFVD